jgi:hypothetical protein
MPFGTYEMLIEREKWNLNGNGDKFVWIHQWHDYDGGDDGNNNNNKYPWVYA